MTSQNRKDIINSMVAQIAAEVTDFNYVADEVRHRTELASDQFPSCIIKEGSTRPGGFISSTEQLFMMVAAEICCDSSSQDDDLRDLAEATIDAVRSDLTLGGTCIVCNLAPTAMSRPQYWPGDSYKYMDIYFEIQYWRDVP